LKLLLTSGVFWVYNENVLSAEMLTRIDWAVQEVARHGHGAVVIVVEKGRARRLRLEVDLSWDKLSPEQVLELKM
jgi:hypothetical protein